MNPWLTGMVSIRQNTADAETNKGNGIGLQAIEFNEFNEFPQAVIACDFLLHHEGDEY